MQLGTAGLETFFCRRRTRHHLTCAGVLGDLEGLRGQLS
jgi:hypothetical protein